MHLLKGTHFSRAPVYPILDYDLCRERGIALEGLLAVWKKAGVRFYQLRAKSLAEKEYEGLAMHLLSISDLPLIINDYYSLALASPSFAGLHVGQADLPEAARSLVLSGSCLKGISTHNESQVQQACLESWDYIALGPIFSGGLKKQNMHPFLEEDALRICLEHIRKAAKVPVLIGGLTALNFPSFAEGAIPAVISTAMDGQALQALIKKVEGLYASARMET